MTTLADVRAQLDALADPKALAVNAKHGDDHAVNLTKLRAVAKDVGRDPALARELWATGDSAARLVGILAVRPSDVSAQEVDAWVRESRTPKVFDWVVNYLAKKHKGAEDLRVQWMADADPDVQAAGWALTTERIAKTPDGLDLPALLDDIEARMRDAPAHLQWGMNAALATIGIHHAELRPRAVAIGERLEVLKDYPTPPNCTSPYAPVWIAEMVRRAEEN